MISGRIRLQTAIAAVAALISAAPAWACELADVLQSRAAIAESNAAYTEERHIHYVTAPVKAAGNLSYKAPDHLEMNVQTPKPESFIYQDGVLTVGEGGRDISVESEALLSALFAALVGTLSGDESKLRDRFDVFFTDTECNWRMTLVPKQERVRAKVDGIEIAGRDGSIGEILLKLANGDRSVLTIREAE
jgi:Outer membrane lipoprotein carrier protein LolA-like